jgi:hypothetical protein
LELDNLVDDKELSIQLLPFSSMLPVLNSWNKIMSYFNNKSSLFLTIFLSPLFVGFSVA